ncbi:hypothetical protein Srot_0646 [Segniliparus rotundus DSM 44985]|uniref:Uncharacterized protein n=1 Tax=Segniliparus rotundus (strain ATCC BAA-972 / CDC 1076 / CIP 108378 / DSM 44985 / JCM 13578) TaxID=640132 RepID=D6ZCT6_SEGRD|nr:hypothetical protein [Segniliparus rotundus]ADG97128.1 hypothetical protein Srot_0646 [Segniliparus rotundus DSM 44985]
MGQALNADQAAMMAHAEQTEQMALMLDGTIAFDPSVFQGMMTALGPVGAPFAAAFTAAITNQHINAHEVAAALHAHAEATRESALHYETTEELSAAELAADQHLAEELGDQLDSVKSEADKFEPFKDDPSPIPNSETLHGVHPEQFEHVYGRAPQSDADWKMAAIMDTQSMVGRNHGVPARVDVGRINPVPGQGIVRVGLYIPATDVLNMPNDLGDARGPKEQFDPRETRVSLYIDYENGVVAARQNPSVDIQGNTQVQDPTVNVSQTADGRLRIQYDATNPLAPSPSHALGLSVNGDIMLTPTANGVHIDGQVGNYPSLEIYQDRDGTTTPAYNYEASGSKLGPVEGLQDHHPLGTGNASAVPNVGTAPPREYQPGVQWDGPGIQSHQTPPELPVESMKLEPEDSDNVPSINPVAPSVPPATHGEI